MKIYVLKEYNTDRIVCINKIEVVTDLMNEYFGESIIIDEPITEKDLSDFEFVKENVPDDVNEEDFEFYKDSRYMSYMR